MVIFIYENAPAHKANPVRRTLETLSWEVLLHTAYSPDLFSSLNQTFAKQRFSFCEDFQEMVRDQKRKIFIGVILINYPKDGRSI